MVACDQASRASCSLVVRWSIALLAVLIPSWIAAKASCAEEPDQASVPLTRFGEPMHTDLAALIARVTAAGWTVQFPADDGIPWCLHGLTRGVHMRLADAQDHFDLWAVPPEWAGIRIPVAPGQPYVGLWVRSLSAMRLIVTVTDQLPGAPLIKLLDPGGEPDRNESRPWQQRIPSAAMPEQSAAATTAARILLARYCTDDTALEQGIASLIELKVPANALYLETAMHGSLPVRIKGIEALAALHTPEGAHAICALLNPVPGDEVGQSLRRTISEMMVYIADAAWIPDLRSVLAESQDSDDRAGAARLLGLLGCTAAAPRIQELMKKTDPDLILVYVQALARLGNWEVAPIIVDHLDAVDITGQDLEGEPKNQNVQFYKESFLTLTAPWSKPADHARILLLPFATSVPMGTGCVVTLVIQATDREITSLDYLEGMLTVDGVEHATEVGAAIGYFGVWPGAMAWHSLDLGAYITSPGTHQIGYRSHTMVAHPISIAVTAP